MSDWSFSSYYANLPQFTPASTELFEYLNIAQIDSFPNWCDSPLSLVRLKQTEKTRVWWWQRLGLGVRRHTLVMEKIDVFGVPSRKIAYWKEWTRTRSIAIESLFACFFTINTIFFHCSRLYLFRYDLELFNHVSRRWLFAECCLQMEVKESWPRNLTLSIAVRQSQMWENCLAHMPFDSIANMSIYV